MKNSVLMTLFALLLVGPIYSGIITAVDETWVCGVKRSCLECLRLPQCTWCTETSECFSKSMPGREEFCNDNATLYMDYGLSLDGNARCACIGDELELNCYPPGVTEGEVCSNRGQCECGRCVCDPTPDINHTTKVIIGEYCEFDNFSCDGPHCNEGPYHIEDPYSKQLENEEDAMK